MASAATVGGVIDYVAALGLTLLVEVPVVVILLRALGWRVFGRDGWWSRVALAVTINLLTHPLLWLTLRAVFGHGEDLAWLAGAEVAATTVESVIIVLACRRPRRDLGIAVLAGVAANAASLAVGLAAGL